MSHVLYAYIAKPKKEQVDSFLRALGDNRVSLSHLGKRDPPRKFGGTFDEAVSLIFSGTDSTNYTFARDAARRLDLDVQIHEDPRWTHSTVSASCPDTQALRIIADCALAAFDLFIAIQGLLSLGKEQPWEIVHITQTCPDELRTRFTAA
jgi:hypothetical protein